MNKIINKLKTDFDGLGMFVVLWLGQTLSSLGSSMTNFALIIWAYKQTGSALDMAIMGMCTYLPYVFISIFAGAFADNSNKKKIMLFCDFISGLATVFVLIGFNYDFLQINHIYMVNLIMGFMNAFQSPAMVSTTTIFAKKSQYTRVGGMQAFSNSVNTLLTPILATGFLSAFGIHSVIIFDIITFLIAFLSLLFIIKIPENQEIESKDKLNTKNVFEGLKFLLKNKPILMITIYFSFINLLSSMTGNELMPAMVLSRTGNDLAVAVVSLGVGIGSILGSIVVTFIKPFRDKAFVMLFSCGISFLLGDILWGLGTNQWVWFVGGILGNFPVPFITSNLSTIMRNNIPEKIHGSVFAARNTLQYFMIPVGLFLGGFLAENVFEPFMKTESRLTVLFSNMVGSGKGSGIALIFLITGVLGATGSFVLAKRKVFDILN